MFRRKKVDRAKLARAVETARQQAEEAREALRRVESSTGEIMGEVAAHKELLRRNNFADRWRAVLGGEGP